MRAANQQLSMAQHFNVSDNVVRAKPQVEMKARTCKDRLIEYKWHLLILAIVAVLLVGGSVGLYFYLSPQGEITESVEIPFYDSTTFKMMKVKVTDRNIFEENKNLTFLLTYVENGKTGRLLQEQTQKFQLCSNHKQSGISICVDSKGHATFPVDLAKFIQFLKKQQTTESSENTTNMTAGSIDEFMEQMGKIFSEALQASGLKEGKVKFSGQTMVNLKTKDGKLEFDIEGSSNRALFAEYSRGLFIKGAINAVGQVVKPVVSGLADVVREHGPTIGKVVGGVAGGAIGLAIGGPVGIVPGVMNGMNIGGAIGSAASTLVDACIPRDSFRISCSPSGIGNAASQLLPIIPNLFPGFSGFPMGNQVPGGSNGFFGDFNNPNAGPGGFNFGGMFNIPENYNGFPAQAFANYAFGSFLG